MEIKLNLIIPVIVEAVKAETYIKGTIDRASGNDQHASNAVAFHETAGDEEVHERKIMRGIYTSSDKLCSFIQDYLAESNNTIGDNAIVNVNETTGVIELKISLTNRFRKPNSNSLARLCSKFIEDQTLVWWWGAIGNANQIQFYQAMLTEDKDAILRLFIKTAPTAVEVPYTSEVSITDSDGDAIASTGISIDANDSFTIKYELDENVLDDIEVISDNGNVTISRLDNHQIKITGKRNGVSNVTLYSIHDETVYASVKVTVTDADGSASVYSEPHHAPYPELYPFYPNCPRHHHH